MRALLAALLCCACQVQLTPAQARAESALTCKARVLVRYLPAAIDAEQVVRDALLGTADPTRLLLNLGASADEVNQAAADWARCPGVLPGTREVLPAPPDPPAEPAPLTQS